MHCLHTAEECSATSMHASQRQEQCPFDPNQLTFFFMHLVKDSGHGNPAYGNFLLYAPPDTAQTLYTSWLQATIVSAIISSGTEASAACPG